MIIEKIKQHVGAKAKADDGREQEGATPEQTCMNCGIRIQEGAHFCPQCGKDLSQLERSQKIEKSRKREKKAKKAIKRIGGVSAMMATNELAGFERMYKSGLAETTEGVFSSTLEFSDIPYEHERQDVKDDIYYKWCMLHQSFPIGSAYQINLINLPNKRYDVDRYLPEEGAQAEHARAYNDIIEQRQLRGRTEFDRLNYISFAVPAESAEAAMRTIGATTESVIAHMARLKGKARALDGSERMQLMHKLVRGAHEPYTFDYSLIENTTGVRARDYIAPGYACYEGEDVTQKHTLSMPGRYVRTYHIKDFGSDLSDSAIRSIRALPIPMNISLLFRPQVTNEMVKRINENIATVHAEMQAYEKSLGKQGASIAHLPPSMENREADSIELLDFIRDKEQHISWFQGLITIYADNREQMEVYETMLNDERGKYSLDITRMPLQQEQAFVSALPLATPRLDKRYRSLATAECAAMIPFRSQNIHDDPLKSYMLGVDTVSGDSILVDPDNIKSPHMWIFGNTGAGKGMEVNALVEYMQAQHPRTVYDEKCGKYVCDDERAPQMHIIDHHAEYVNVGEYYGGTVERFGAGHDACLNLMNLKGADGELDARTIMQNADFFLSLVRSIMGRPLANDEKNLLDICVRECYEPHIGKSTRPSLKDFHAVLSRKRREGAKQLADSLNIFVNGSFNAFSEQTNIATDPQLNVYDCSEVGPQMQVLALLAILQHVRNCTYENHKIGKPTYLIVEECQIIFDIDELIDILDSFFGELRKYGLHIICVTQLPSRVINHDRAVYLFENSGIFVFLPQQDKNADKLASMFALSQTQRDKITSSAEAGTGLVIADGMVISMQNRIPKDSILYEAWNTDPYKLAEAEKQTSADRRDVEEMTEKESAE